VIVADRATGAPHAIAASASAAARTRLKPGDDIEQRP
jgi:hypothetical protein